MDRSVLLLRMFRFLESKASGRIVAETEAMLASGQLLTVRAGGVGFAADPAGGGLGTFEVMLDHDPPRFWARYGNSRQTLYTKVPRLLLSHHIIRAGGIAHIGYSHYPTPGAATVEMRLSVPADRARSVEMLIGGIDGVRIDEIVGQKAPI